MEKISVFISLSLTLLLLSCTATEKQDSIRQEVEEYYQTYQQREDFQRFLSFYSDDVVLEDMISGDKIEGKSALAEFFNWDTPGFQKTEDQALIITEQIIEGNKVVTKGYFTPFQWGETRFEAMHFTTLLTFNEQGKIIKHVDWINYPSTLLNYQKRKNSNSWLIK